MNDGLLRQSQSQIRSTWDGWMDATGSLKGLQPRRCLHSMRQKEWVCAQASICVCVFKKLWCSYWLISITQFRLHTSEQEAAQRTEFKAAIFNAFLHRSPFQRVTLQVEPVVFIDSYLTLSLPPCFLEACVILCECTLQATFSEPCRALRKTNSNSGSVFLCSSTQTHWFSMNPAEAAILQTLISKPVKCAMLWRSF